MIVRPGPIVHDGMQIAGERVDLKRAPVGDYVHYGIGWKRDEEGEWFVPSALSGSDLSGGFVNRANFEWFEDTYGEDVKEFFYYTDGGHGTYGIVLYIAETPGAVWDALARAEQYPVIDENRMTEMEEEAKDQAWIDWAGLQFQGALAAQLVRRGLTIEEASDLADEIDEAGDLRNVFELCRDKANVDWHPDGDRPEITIDIERAAEGCAELTFDELKSGHLSPEEERRRGREFIERQMERAGTGRPAPERERPQTVEQLAGTPAGELTGAEIAQLQRHWGYPAEPAPRYRPELPPAEQRPKFDWAAMTPEQRDYWRSLGYEPPPPEQLRRRIVDYRRRGLIEGYHYNPENPLQGVTMYRGARRGDPTVLAGPSYFISSEQFAKTYGPTAAFELDLENPLVVSNEEWFQYTTDIQPMERIVERLRRSGHDSVVNVRDTPAGKLYAVLLIDPSRATLVEPEALVGGRAAGMRPEDFDPVELRRGTEHELEHTGDERVAQEIAMDHLAEDPLYYRKLERAGL